MPRPAALAQSTSAWIRPRPLRPLRFALWQLLIAACALTSVEAALLIEQWLAWTWALVLFAVAGLEAVIVGLVAWDRRPRHSIGEWLATGDAARPPPRDALAQVLGDSSLELYVRITASGELLDTGGHPVAAIGGPSRETVQIQGVHGLAATIVYDRSMVADRRAVESAGQVVTLALEHDRLTAEVLASQEAIRQSRARLAEADDAERRRFAHDLHDVLQNRLVLAAVHAGRLASGGGPGQDVRAAAEDLRRALDGAITELRRQVHGLMPALLIERGLCTAVEELAGRLPLPAVLDLSQDQRPLPPAVASTGYSVVAEAVSNAVKHSRATKLTVRIHRNLDLLNIDVLDDGIGGAVAFGAGLAGLAARVEALEGEFRLDSPPGGGTTVGVRLPCGS